MGEPSFIKRIVRDPMFRHKVEKPGRGKGSYQRKPKGSKNDPVRED